MRTTLLGLFLFFASAFVFPEEVQIQDTLHVVTDSGVLFSWGTAHEIVYHSSSSSDTSYTSELVWPIVPSLGAWSSITVAWLPWLDTHARVSGVFPLMSGAQTDDDWNITLSSVFYSRVHSDSIAYPQANWEGSLEFGFPQDWEGVRWRPVVGVDYHFLSWIGWNAAQTLTQPNGTISTNSFWNLTFTYQQSWLLPYLGFEVNGVWEEYTWNLGFRGSPYAFCNDMDGHVTSLDTYFDQMMGGWMADPSVSLGWQFMKGWTVTVDADAMWVMNLRGNTIYAHSTLNPTQPTNSLFSNQAGAWLFRLNAGVGLKVSL